MSDDKRSQISDNQPDNDVSDDEQLQTRRGFLIGLGKWSQAVIGGAILGAGVLATEKSAAAASWINRRGGGGWINGGGGWINGGGSWINGSRGGWVNRRGGGGWINRRR